MSDPGTRAQDGEHQGVVGERPVLGRLEALEDGVADPPVVGEAGARVVELVGAGDAEHAPVGLSAIARKREILDFPGNLAGILPLDAVTALLVNWEHLPEKEKQKDREASRDFPRLVPDGPMPQETCEPGPCQGALSGHALRKGGTTRCRG